MKHFEGPWFEGWFTTKRWWAGAVIGIVAYLVMPDGPWYREVGAAFLASVSSAIVQGDL